MFEAFKQFLLDKGSIKPQYGFGDVVDYIELIIGVAAFSLQQVLVIRQHSQQRPAFPGKYFANR
jgi:hypothetical protein